MNRINPLMNAIPEGPYCLSPGNVWVYLYDIDSKVLPFKWVPYSKDDAIFWNDLFQFCGCFEILISSMLEEEHVGRFNLFISKDTECKNRPDCRGDYLVLARMWNGREILGTNFRFNSNNYVTIERSGILHD